VGRAAAFWQSTIGKKVVMAATGLIMIGYVVLHMAGNLQIFLGPEKLDAYSYFLHHQAGELLWVVRAVLLVSVALHIVAARQLTRIDSAARPIGYARLDPQASTLSSRTMRWGGVILALFILFHLLHFTTGTIRPTAFDPADVYGNLTRAFRVWWVVLIYVAAMIALGLHLYHGGWSAVRTLGLARPSASPMTRPVAALIAVLVWVGFTIVPLSIFLGFVR